MRDVCKTKQEGRDGMKAKILVGNRKDEVGFVRTIVDSEGDDTALLEFEDGSFETFDSKDIRVSEE